MDFMRDITEKADKAIANRVFPGCVVGLVTADGGRYVLPFGRFTYEANSPQVKEDTMYDTASITKCIPTGSLALMLIDQGKLQVTDRLIDYVPEFRNSNRELVTIQHLLTYTLDGYGLASMKPKNAEDVLNILLTHDFEKRPGTVFKYSNIPAALLGLVVERIMGDTLDKLADEHFFRPLEMSHTTFYPEQYPKEAFPPTEIDNWRGLVQGVVHDESAYICKQDGKIMGHAGLFSTAPNILNYLEMLLNMGSFKGRQYFSKEMVAAMGTNQIPELNDCTGLGWELNQPRFMGSHCAPRTFGKTGFTGTLCVVDVEKGIAYVILSNRTYPTRSVDSAEINKFRAAIGEILL